MDATRETTEETCTAPKPDVDPCLKLLDATIFGQCHAIVDADLYVKKCHSILCQGLEGSFCHSLEAYVRECQSFGVCVDWRSPNLCPYSCPEGKLSRTVWPPRYSKRERRARRVAVQGLFVRLRGDVR